MSTASKSHQVIVTACQRRRCEDAAVVFLFSLAASGQIKLRRTDGWLKIAAVLRQHTGVAA